MLAILFLTSFIWAPILVGLIWCDRCRAFLGYNILIFGVIFVAFYAVHLTGIVPGY